MHIVGVELVQFNDLFNKKSKNKAYRMERQVRAQNRKEIQLRQTNLKRQAESKIQKNKQSPGNRALGIG